MKPQGSAIRGKTSGTGQGKPGATLRFGPAGWMYKDWEGIVYPHPKPPRFHDSIGPTAHATSHVGYIRVHGRNYKDWFREKAPVEQRYNYLYPADELKPWAERAKAT